MRAKFIELTATILLPFKNESFDCILAIEVFEHLENPEVFVDEAYRVLNKTGIMFVTVPFMFHEHGDPSDYQSALGEQRLCSLHRHRFQ